METNNPHEVDNVHHLYGEEHSYSYQESSGGRETWQGMLEHLYRDMGRLWDKERRLISTEISEKVADVKAASVSLITGGVLLFVGVICAAATAIIALSNVTEPWIASLIVTLALVGIGAIMVKAASKKFDADQLRPQHSVEALSEIRQTFQERIHEFKKH